MSVSEKLERYASKMNVRFLIVHFHAVEQLEKEIGTYLQRYITTYGTRIDFKSSEIRHFILSFEKAHKSLNKITSFIGLNKKFEKYKLIGADELRKELKINADMVHLVTKVQYILASLNRYATLLDMLEKSIENSKQLELKEKERVKKESDSIFEHCVYEALVEACSGN